MVDASLIGVVEGGFARRRRVAMAVPVLILVYLIYAAVAFDVPGVVARARMDNAAILLSDFWSYKVQVTRDNKSGAVISTVEGDARYAVQPDWVTEVGGVTTVDLGRGNVVTYDAGGARYVVPGYGTIDIRPVDGKLALTAPLPLPDWISASDTRVGVTTLCGAVQLHAVEGGDVPLFCGVGDVLLYAGERVL